MPDKVATFTGKFSKLSQEIGGGLNSTTIVHETDYNALINKPKINEVTLQGNKELPDLGVRTISALEMINLWNSVK